jgi:hypothetical protein
VLLARLRFWGLDHKIERELRLGRAGIVTAPASGVCFPGSNVAGEMAEWLKAHAWKAVRLFGSLLTRYKQLSSSNLLA